MALETAIGRRRWLPGVPVSEDHATASISPFKLGSSSKRMI